MIDNFQFFAFAFLVMIPHGSPEKSNQNLSHTTYSKSQILVQKFNLTRFSPKIFLTLCLVKSKLSTAKKSKTTTFSRVFHPKKIDTFSREIKVVNSQKVQNHNIFTSFSPKKIYNFLGKSNFNFWTKKMKVLNSVSQ